MLLDFLHLSRNRYVYFRNRASKQECYIEPGGY